MTQIHPRPQLSRPTWWDLCGRWDFAYDDANVGLHEGWYRREVVYDRSIVVPFPPESPASGIGDPSFHPVVWYRRTFQIEQHQRGGRLLLHFGAVDYGAQVWVNGQLVAVHAGGHTPFYADITDALGEEVEGVVVVRAEDRPDDLMQPRGKQDWQEQPHRIWYDRTTGIWQPVWIECVSPTHVESLRWTPALDRGLLGLSLTFQRQTDTPLQVRVHLSMHGNFLADNTYTVTGRQFHTEMALDGLHLITHREMEQILWSPEHPNLVDATISVLAGTDLLDEVRSYVGLRSVATEDGQFLLNGRPYYLRLVLEQGYWPESHLASPNPDALRQEVEWIKRLGFNGVRIHQKVEDPRFLYWCDRLGLLVWGEMANAYAFSSDAVAALSREWTDVVLRDFNHPCIVTWVPLNESWGVPNLARDSAQRHYVQLLYHLTKTLDPTRPVIGNDGWEYLVGDMVGVHDYAFSGETLRERYGSAEALERTAREVRPHYHAVILPGQNRAREPVILSECGGISYRPTEESSWHGYGTVSDADEFLAKYTELVDAILECPTIAGFCYTQLTDTQQEANGLLGADRRPKLDPDAVRRVTTRPAASVPGDVTLLTQEARGISPFSSPSEGKA